MKIDGVIYSYILEITNSYKCCSRNKLNLFVCLFVFLTHFNSLLHCLMLSGRIAMQAWAEMGKALLQTLLIKILKFVNRSGTWPNKYTAVYVTFEGQN